MKKKLLLAGALVSLMGTTAQAQTTANPKWDAIAESLIQKQQKAIVGTKSTTKPEVKGFVISCTEAATVAEAIQREGYEATIINDQVVTASFPVNYLHKLAEMEEVTFINGSRQFKSFMNSTREVLGIDKIHQGTDLETPFTGKGVIVGVIDQGFEYNHIAFQNADKKTRVLAVWDHYNKKKPTENISSSATSDGIPGAGGHATHVTNIAAGSKVKGNNFYGIAYDADIIMVPSQFTDDKVLEEAKYISDFAKKEGKPFVINMSFGSQIGPHDGSSAYCKAMSDLSQPGGILVAAMGNEGEMKIHGHHKFTEANEKVYLIMKPDADNPYGNVDLWEQTADNQKHLTVKPIVFTKSNKKKDYKNTAFWNSCSNSSSSIDPQNKKEHFYYEINYNNAYEIDGNRTYFGLEVTGNPGDEIHAWINPSWGEFYTVMGNEYVKGDDEYCVGEGAAAIPYAIAVASFNGNNGSFTSANDGNQYGWGGNSRTKGAISDFSSRGPSLGTEQKPLVAAPGSNVHSAVCRYGSDFDKTSNDIVGIVKEGFNKYYYSSMCGTSMASPAMAGTVALWLQANPELTYQQIKEILQETSIRDRYSKDKNEAGYGKLNAYEGLKMALKMAENTGIYDQLNSEAPVSIQRESDAFRILFNNDESYANITLYNASGVAVKQVQLTDVRRGEENVISAAGLPAGVYVININTTASHVSKKMLVK